MSKEFFCDNCKRRTIKDNKIVSVLCPCGEYMTPELDISPELEKALDKIFVNKEKNESSRNKEKENN